LIWVVANLRAPRQNDFCLDILNSFNQDEPALLDKVPVHGSDLPAKDAIDRDGLFHSDPGKASKVSGKKKRLNTP